MLLLHNHCFFNELLGQALSQKFWKFSPAIRQLIKKKSAAVGSKEVCFVC